MGGFCAMGTIDCQTLIFYISSRFKKNHVASRLTIAITGFCATGTVDCRTLFFTCLLALKSMSPAGSPWGAFVAMQRHFQNKRGLISSERVLKGVQRPSPFRYFRHCPAATLDSKSKSAKQYQYLSHINVQRCRSCTHCL